ncbi:MAG: DinB family protein [Chloroflexota bacterium]
MSAVLDPFVLQHAPGPLVELDPALVRARSAFRTALAAFAALTEDELTYQWMWDGHEADVRYSFYLGAWEVLARAATEATRAMAGAVSSEPIDAVAATTVARWQLHGVLATLSEADLDADPGSGEWTIRRTLQHTVNSQRGYAWGSAYWLSVRDEPRKPGPQRAPEGVMADFPEEEDEALGDLASIRRELDDAVDATTSRYATLTPEEMQVKAGWAGIPVTIGFRQWRWSSHIVEHTIQVEKTLDMLGRRRSEVDWLVRSVAGAYGRLEAAAFGRADATAAAGVFDRVARELRDLAPSVQAAAVAAVPGDEH